MLGRITKIALIEASNTTTDSVLCLCTWSSHISHMRAWATFLRCIVRDRDAVGYQNTAELVMQVVLSIAVSVQWDILIWPPSIIVRWN